MSTWSCRLEDILSIAVEKKVVDPMNVNDMLRNMFWQGLKPSLKEISGYKYDKVKDFDQLRVEIRKLEQEHNHPGSMVMTGIKSVIDNKENSEMKEIKTMLQSLDSTVKVLEKKLNKQESQQQGYKQNKTGGYKGNYNNSKPRYQNDTQRYSNNPRYQKPYISSIPSI